MKKITSRFVALAVMVLCTLGSFAQKLSIEPVEIIAGQQAVVNVNYESSVDNKSAQFDITLPEGLSFVEKKGIDEDEEEYTYYASKGDATLASHDLKEKIQESGALRVIIASTKAKNLKESGVLISFDVVADENFESGNITLSDIVFSTGKVEETVSGEVSATLPVIVTPSFSFADEEVALNDHSIVSVESADAIVVQFENVKAATATYVISSMIEIQGEETSTWEVNESIASGEFSINERGYAALEEALTFYQGSKYQLAITYQSMDPAAEPVVLTYEFNGATAVPFITSVEITSAGEAQAINTHSEASLESVEAIKVTFGNSVDVKEASYVISSMNEVVGEESTSYEIGATVAEGAISVNTIGYAELAEPVVLSQGTKYNVAIKVVYKDGSDESESFVVNGAYALPIDEEIIVSLVANDSIEFALNSHSTVSVYEAINAIKVQFGDMSPMEEAAYAIYSKAGVVAEGLLSVNNIGYAEFKEPVNFYEGVPYLAVITVAGEEVASFDFVGGVEAQEEPVENILGTPEIAIADNTLSIKFTAPEGVENPSLASAGVQIVKGSAVYYGYADEAYAENGVIAVNVNLGGTMDMETYAPYEPTEGDELTIVITEPEIWANYADGTFEKVWAGDDIEASYTVEAGEPVIADAPLTKEMFKEWDSYQANPTAVGQAPCDFVFGSSTGMPYGNGSVIGSFYADLTAYGTLALTVTEGAPRLLLNRQDMGGSSPDFLEINNANSPYVKVKGDVWYIDLTKITEEKGYAHLNVIKGANWQNVTITEAMLYVDGIDAVMTATGVNGFATVTKANGKFIENGKIVIVRNGVKFNVNGTISK